MHYLPIVLLVFSLRIAFIQPQPLGISPLTILVIQPNNSFIRSHFDFGFNIAKYLYTQGHNVHILVPIKEKSDQIQDKAWEEKLNVRYYKQKKSAEEFQNNLKRVIGSGGCAGAPTPDDIYLDIIADVDLINDLRKIEFQVGIAEAFFASDYALAIMHILGIPHTIATHAMPVSPYQLHLLGALEDGRFNRAMVPCSQGFIKNRGAKIGDHRTAQLMSRREEILETCQQNANHSIVQHQLTDLEYQNLVLEKHFMANLPKWEEMFHKTRFLLVNSQPEVDFGNWSMFEGDEKVKFIGGFQLKSEQNPIEKEIDDKLISHAGLILISFGTNMDTTKPEHGHLFRGLKSVVQQFRNYLFVWKMNRGDPNIGIFMQEIPNVYTTYWVDQQAILAHPKCAVFVSHCGMNSVLEGAFHGVPFLCVPFFADQYYNSESLARQHLGTVIDRELDQQQLEHDIAQGLRVALGQEKSENPEDQIDLKKVKEVSAELKPKNIRHTIDQAMNQIRSELL